ncbi:SDR family NAD(P)-dependent oxidoreductase [Anaeromicropila populeti]|uniref:Short-chain dehydrogenase n=1 Tax=Anaeromicropila populeti TaxID=37658 RepID=A0A1I6KKK0_9FIRM|nr:SDR family oxidoreductase [Anaeromicropila populeti]SFR91719.1 hypothetical protein SAMN05661086_02490 [Anaeromicropila populeti]
MNQMQETSYKEKKQIAIVTGASSGIGLEISRQIVSLGYSVFGFGRDFTKTSYSSPQFHPISMDLTNIHELQEKIKELKREYRIFILVNNAGIGYFGLHEELNPLKIHEMVTLNVEVPFVLTQLLLRDLKREAGFLFNISSITAKKNNPHGCAYGATKAALTSFSSSLFEEARKYGVTVTAVHPDMTKSNFYRNADFKESEETDCHILAEEVADFVSLTLKLRSGLCLSDVTIQPQKHRLAKRIL